MVSGQLLNDTVYEIILHKQKNIEDVSAQTNPYLGTPRREASYTGAHHNVPYLPTFLILDEDST